MLTKLHLKNFKAWKDVTLQHCAILARRRVKSILKQLVIDSATLRN